jgi:hypothetical protein
MMHANPSRSMLWVVRRALEAVQAIQAANSVTLSNDMAERFTGAEAALKLMLGQRSYLRQWVESAGRSIKLDHASYRQDCSCAVCKEDA